MYYDCYFDHFYYFFLSEIQDCSMGVASGCLRKVQGAAADGREGSLLPRGKGHSFGRSFLGSRLVFQLRFVRNCFGYIDFL